MPKSSTHPVTRFLFASVGLVTILMFVMYGSSAGGSATLPLFLVGVYFLASLFVGWLAEREAYRSIGVWTLLAFLLSPFVALIFLLVAGTPVSAYDQFQADRQQEMEQERGRAERRCPSCGASFNSVTGEGLSSPEDEPWRLICEQCDREIDVEAFE